MPVVSRSIQRGEVGGYWLDADADAIASRSEALTNSNDEVGAIHSISFQIVGAY